MQLILTDLVEQGQNKKINKLVFSMRLISCDESRLVNFLKNKK